MEKANTGKFAKVQQWFSPITAFVAIGFKNYGSKTGGYKGAVSYALKNAVSGDHEIQFVNPELVQVSGGDLHFPAIAEVSMDEKYVLHFSWDVKGGKPHDQVMLLAYAVEEKVFHQKITGTF